MSSMSTIAPPLITDAALVQELAGDLDWLQQRIDANASRQPKHGAQVRLASGLVRNVLGLFLENGKPSPLHVVVVGGAGTGKSTVANLLLGKPLAESNPQAGFTRHPVAYMPEDGQADWPTTPGFLAPLHLLPGNRPANLDENVYQIRRFVPVLGDDLLRHAVVWDCPDVTTWHSVTYLPRVLEVVSLADAVVYVASDERYNDEVPTQLLRLILQSGKPVVCVLTKMREADVETLLKHFRQDVVDRMPNADRVAACVAVPFLDPRILADPVGQGRRWREPLLNALRNCFSHPLQARTATVRGAVQFMQDSTKDLVAAVSEDLAALNTWKELVEQGRREFESRYFREYLSSKKFHRFDQSFVKLIELLELPGIGKYVSKTVALTRIPWTVAKNLYRKFVGKSDVQEMPEEPIFRAALRGWLDRLQVEAAKRSKSHPIFAKLDEAFKSTLRSEVENRYQACLPEFRRGLEEEVERTARAIYEDVEKNPVLLNSLRGIKLSVEVSTVIAILISGGINVWDPILIMIITPFIQEITEFLGKQYVEKHKAGTRQRQLELMSRTVAVPLEDWLARLPVTSTDQFHRLEQIVERLPQNIALLKDAVTRRLEESRA